MIEFQAITAVATEKTRYSGNNQIKETFYTNLLKLFELLERPDPKFAGLKVLSQRDYWRNNLMFQFDRDENGNFNYFEPKHCVILDYQTARYCPLAIDVLFVIIANTRKTHHQEKIQNYLQYYYKELEKHVDLQSKMPFESFLESYRYFTLTALIINTITVSLTLLPKDVMRNLNEQNTEMFQKICNVDRKDFIFECMDSDPYYRECLVEAVEELIEFLYFNKGLI